MNARHDVGREVPRHLRHQLGAVSFEPMTDQRKPVVRSGIRPSQTLTPIDATSAVVEWKGGKRLAVPLSDVRDRVWAFYDDDWRKSTVVKIKKKTGARVIELPGGEKKSIPAERVKPMLA